MKEWNEEQFWKDALTTWNGQEGFEFVPPTKDYPGDSYRVSLEDLVVWLVKNRREMVRKAYLLGSSSGSPRLHAEYETELSKRLAGNTMGFVPLDEIGVKDAS